MTLAYSYVYSELCAFSWNSEINFILIILNRLKSGKAASKREGFMAHSCRTCIILPVHKNELRVML